MRFFVLMLLSVSLWANIGNIMALKGSAEVKRSSGALQAISGMALEQGDEVVTQAKTKVQVMLKDDTVITIGPNSSFSFEEFSFDGTSASKLNVKANRGFFRSVTGKIGKVAPERFKVKTASATIGIRGTDFSALIGEVEVIECHSGTIYVEFEGNTYDIESGMMIEIIPESDGIKSEATIKEVLTQRDSSLSQRVQANMDIIEQIVEGNSDLLSEEIADVTIDADEEHIPLQENNEPFDLELNPQDRDLQF